MKQYWQPIVVKIDALSLRERAMIFAAATVFVVMLVNNLLLDKQFSQQKQLSEQVKANYAQILLLRTEMQQQQAIQATDPDVESRVHLLTLQQQLAQLQLVLKDMQKGLVSPD